MAERNLDFDRIVSRKNTRCLKHDFASRRGYPENILSLWVADMDFRTSSYVEDALSELTRHNIYGYSNTQPGDGFFEAVSGWMKRHHRWEVDPAWHVKTPGVCFAIATAVRAFTDSLQPAQSGGKGLDRGRAPEDRRDLRGARGDRVQR